MEVSLYEAAAAMNATAKWQELIADNLTSSSISGGRKCNISFSDIPVGMEAGMSNNTSAAFTIPTAKTVTNFQPGELHVSSNPMDFALEGPGFFSVQLPNGQTAYTRGGEFQLNGKGQLVTNQGFLVLGSGGPIQFNPNSTDTITIAPNGEVSQGQESKGTLRLTEFKNPNDLTMIGAEDFESNNPAAQPMPAASTTVRQGFLEAANTSPTTEMAGLVTAMRMFEANQKVMQAQSDRMSRAISELGGTT